MKELAIEYAVESESFKTNRGALRPGLLLPVVAGDINIIHLTAKKDGTAYDLSAWPTALFGYKSQSVYEAGGDYRQAWLGYFDDAHHDLSAGKLSVAFTAPHEDAGTIWRAGLALQDDLNQWHFGDSPLLLPVYQAVNTGTESNAPSGANTPLTGIAEITGSNTSIVVSVTGMTTGGFVLPWLAASTAGQTVPWVSAYSAGSFTLMVNAAPEVDPGDGLTWRIGWKVLRK